MDEQVEDGFDKWEWGERQFLRFDPYSNRHFGSGERAGLTLSPGNTRHTTRSLEREWKSLLFTSLWTRVAVGRSCGHDICFLSFSLSLFLVWVNIQVQQLHNNQSSSKGWPRLGKKKKEREGLVMGPTPDDHIVWLTSIFKESKLMEKIGGRKERWATLRAHHCLGHLFT